MHISCQSRQGSSIARPCRIRGPSRSGRPGRSVASHGLIEDVLKPITTAGQIPVLNDGIRKFYDQSSGLWERMWGDHMHHGFYTPGSRIEKTRTQAQVDMIEEVLAFAGVDSVTKMVDVGCGIGGSSRYIAKKTGCSAEGITLSPVQAQRGNELAAAQRLADRCSYSVVDALQQPFADSTFDLVWSLESGEHMPDKSAFVGELFRVAQPGGTVAIVTWCHRNLLGGQATLDPEEQAVLDRVNEAYYLPKWCSLADYEALFAKYGFEDVKSADWSDNIAPFWGEVLSSAMSLEGIRGLGGAGWDTLKGALVVPLMQRGYDMGVIKFVIITGKKPAAATAAEAAGAAA